MKFDVIIVGAGAAGLMCGYMSAGHNKKVLILDHSLKLAEKIRISGGGRCNFTNINTSQYAFISQNPHFCISALSCYTPYYFIQLLDKYNIKYHEKKLGQLFCDNSSEDIINLLDFLNREHLVTRKMGVTINNIEKSNGFKVYTNEAIFNCEALVIATGGLAIPQIGATGFGYNIARQFNLNVITPTPALVPLALTKTDLETFSLLAGNSFLSSVSINKTSFTENTLFTHRGLSGPAILQISSYWQDRQQIKIDMLPESNISQLIYQNKNSAKLLSNFLCQFFSEKISNIICTSININKSICNLSKKEITNLDNFIHHLKINPSGTLGHKKAEVTKGGVDTKDLSSKSMMAKNVDGLFFIGEVVDVTGWLGGYNFQWAWSSAFAAANFIRN